MGVGASSRVLLLVGTRGVWGSASLRDNKPSYPMSLCTVSFFL